MPNQISEYIINARRFKPKSSSNLIVTRLVDQLARDITLGGNIKRKKHLKYLFLDLCARYRENPVGWIYYSRDSNFYTLPIRYNSLRVAYRPLIAVVDLLKRFDLVEDRIGFIDHVTGKSFQSRLRATPELINYFAEIPDLELKEDFTIEASVRLRTMTYRNVRGRLKKTKKYLDYIDTPYTLAIKDQLNYFNEEVASACIDMHMLNSPEYDLIPSVHTELRVNLNRKSLYRVFNDNFDTGGRFYGGWWQNIPSDLRDHILIDGCPTVELDFKGLHIALLYALKGIDYFANENADPYRVDGWNRDDIKLLLQIILNSRSDDHAISAYNDEMMERGLLSVPEPTLKSLVQTFEAMHSPIREYFYSGYGVVLQNIDARIAEFVIHECMKVGVIDLDAASRNEVVRHKFLVLPIHDSFRVKAQCKTLLRRMMIQAVEDVGSEYNEVNDRLFYNYTPRIRESCILEIVSLDDDAGYQGRMRLFESGGVLPELRILRKHDDDSNKDYFRTDDS